MVFCTGSRRNRPSAWEKTHLDACAPLGINLRWISGLMKREDNHFRGKGFCDLGWAKVSLKSRRRCCVWSKPLMNWTIPGLGTPVCKEPPSGDWKATPTAGGKTVNLRTRPRTLVPQTTCGGGSLTGAGRHGGASVKGKVRVAVRRAQHKRE